MIEQLRADTGRGLLQRSIDVSDAGEAAIVPAEPVAIVIDGPVLPGRVGGQPLVAAAADPWLGNARIRVGPDESTLSDRGVIGTPSSIGRVSVDLPARPLGRWDEAAVLEVEMEGADFASLSRLAVLNGAGLLLVQGQAGWELLAYREAILVSDGHWSLTGLLRGLSGSGVGGAVSGSVIVVADETVVEAPLANEEIGLSLLWAVGNSAPVAAVFDDLGRLPWRVGHLQAHQSGADWRVTWTRRGAEISDNWSRPEMGNTGDFRVEVLLDGLVLETVQASTGSANIAVGGDEVRVAEMGDDGRMGAWASIPLLAA